MCGCMWVCGFGGWVELEAKAESLGPKGYELHVLASAACTACHSAFFSSSRAASCIAFAALDPPEP